jgi:signal transduction histidine kinase
LNRQLETANQVKAKFFAILSHDLRSPIARLVSFLQFRKLEPDVLSADQIAEHERKLEEGAQALLCTMESLLLWSKQQMELFQPVKTDVPVQSVFDYIESNFARNESVHVDFLLPENISIHTDENYLRAILYNLTSNAVKATLLVPSPHIEWKAWKNNGSVFFSISDNGPGLSTSQASIFFEGGKSADSQHGFGLHIIRDLARAIDCKLSLGQVEKGMQVLLQFDSAAI